MNEYDRHIENYCKLYTYQTIYRPCYWPPLYNSNIVESGLKHPLVLLRFLVLNATHCLHVVYHSIYYCRDPVNEPPRYTYLLVVVGLLIPCSICLLILRRSGNKCRKPEHAYRRPSRREENLQGTMPGFGGKYVKFT